MIIFNYYVFFIVFKVMEYEHDSTNESLYRTSFIKAFKKKMVENYFSFYIIDAINNKVTYYKDILDISRLNGFTVSNIKYLCHIICLNSLLKIEQVKKLVLLFSNLNKIYSLKFPKHLNKYIFLE